jgi:hypothetical protein
MNCPYNYDEPESRLEWFEKRLEEREEFIKRTFEDWADDDIRVEEMLEPIIGREFIEGDKYCVPGTVGCVEEVVKKYNELKLEKDALYVKTQEDEREINDLRDVNKQLRQWKEEALVVLNEWNEVSEYIRKNTDINDLGKSIPELCLKSLKERNQFKEIMKLNFMSDIPTNEKLLIQRTELLWIAEEMAEVIIGNGASVKDALPIDKLDEFYKKWNIGEPFVRDYKA